MFDEGLQELGRNEEFKVCLLIDVSLAGAPAEHRISAGHSVDSWLRVDGQNLVLIEQDQNVTDLVRLCSEGTLREGELLDLSFDELSEGVRNRTHI